MGVSVSELLILLLIAVVVFGTKRLGDVGSDLGAAIKNFRKAFKEPEGNAPSASESAKPIEGEVIARHDDKN